MPRQQKDAACIHCRQMKVCRSLSPPLPFEALELTSLAEMRCPRVLSGAMLSVCKTQASLLCRPILQKNCQTTVIISCLHMSDHSNHDRRINAIERELQELKTTIESSPASDIQEHNNPSSSYLITESPYATLSGTSNALPTPHLQEPIRAFETQSIDEVEVEPSVISELFDLYVCHYYIPILC